ncbi:DUF6089 family protein [Dysgonomonas sp. 25]|uniref:type IX secretion system protein PorG n=1 Tax=Dysgonomonas sp. 25 TaxID=2302933 RepID=UPI0013D67153|nr:DUF6089 family protein [Dysgonomonas sp. 25]NDV68655.1 hypothetical protein [Dysgonomonas sp. 25]
MKKSTSVVILLLLILSLLSSAKLSAQDYKYEIGGMAGTSFYMGDANKGQLYKDASLAGGIIFRYNQDFRWSVRGNLAVGHITGDTNKSGDAFPNNSQVRFSRNFYELGGQVEFNFFNFSNKYNYLDTKPLTPYVFVGIGCTYASGEKTFTGVNVPIGIGLKYKLRDRVNIGFEFSLRKLFGDDFDVTSKNGFNLNDPYQTNDSWIKNKDWYSLTMFSVTWDFGARCKPCLNY